MDGKSLMFNFTLTPIFSCFYYPIGSSYSILHIAFDGVLFGRPGYRSFAVPFASHPVETIFGKLHKDVFHENFLPLYFLQDSSHRKYKSKFPRSCESVAG